MLMAASIVSVAPIVIVFFFAQKQSCVELR